MYRVIYTDYAIKDIDEIYDYIALDDIEISDRVIDTILSFVENLSSFPLIGKKSESNFGNREIVETKLY